MGEQKKSPTKLSRGQVVLLVLFWPAGLTYAGYQLLKWALPLLGSGGQGRWIATSALLSPFLLVGLYLEVVVPAYCHRELEKIDSLDFSRASPEQLSEGRERITKFTRSCDQFPKEAGDMIEARRRGMAAEKRVADRKRRDAKQRQLGEERRALQEGCVDFDAALDGDAGLNQLLGVLEGHINDRRAAETRALTRALEEARSRWSKECLSDRYYDWAESLALLTKRAKKAKLL